MGYYIAMQERPATTRWLWALFALTGAALTAASLFLTHGVGLRPCHLCIFQRLMFLLWVPLGLWAWRYPHWPAVLLPALGIEAVSLAGAAVAWQQIQLQRHPPTDPLACTGAELGLIERFVEWLADLSPWWFMPTGLCSDLALVVLGGSLAQWAFVAFALGVAASSLGIVLTRRALP